MSWFSVDSFKFSKRTWSYEMVPSQTIKIILILWSYLWFSNHGPTEGHTPSRDSRRTRAAWPAWISADSTRELARDRVVFHGAPHYAYHKMLWLTPLPPRPNTSQPQMLHLYLTPSFVAPNAPNARTRKTNYVVNPATETGALCLKIPRCRWPFHNGQML